LIFFFFAMFFFSLKHPCRSPKTLSRPLEFCSRRLLESFRINSPFLARSYAANRRRVNFCGLAFRAVSFRTSRRSPLWSREARGLAPYAVPFTSGPSVLMGFFWGFWGGVFLWFFKVSGITSKIFFLSSQSPVEKSFWCRFFRRPFMDFPRIGSLPGLAPTRKASCGSVSTHDLFRGS